ncbi:unnamed protein product [Lampetra planeri]
MLAARLPRLGHRAPCTLVRGLKSSLAASSRLVPRNEEHVAAPESRVVTRARWWQPLPSHGSRHVAVEGNDGGVAATGGHAHIGRRPPRGDGAVESRSA